MNASPRIPTHPRNLRDASPRPIGGTRPNGINASPTEMGTRNRGCVAGRNAGWLVSQHQDPATTPVLYRGRWVQLHPDGSLAPIKESA